MRKKAACIGLMASLTAVMAQASVTIENQRSGVMTINMSLYPSGQYTRTALMTADADVEVCLQPTIYLAETGQTLLLTEWDKVTKGSGDIESGSYYYYGNIKNTCSTRITAKITIKTNWLSGYSEQTQILPVDVPAATSCSLLVEPTAALKTDSTGISSQAKLTSGGNGSCSVTVTPSAADESGGILPSSDGKEQSVHYRVTTGTWNAANKQYMLSSPQESSLELFGAFIPGSYSGYATVTLNTE